MGQLPVHLRAREDDWREPAAPRRYSIPWIGLGLFLGAVLGLVATGRLTF